MSRQNEVRDTSNEPAYRITDPMKIGASITVLPPDGGIFCCDGADILTVGQDIKKTAGWKVYYVEKQGVPEVEVSPSLWDVMNDSPSIPCVLRVSIVANIPGRAPLQTTREVTFVNIDSGKANEPIEFVTGPNLPGAYVGGKYKAYVCARMGSGYTGLEWTMSGAPDWLRLESAVALDGMQRTALVGDPEESWEGKLTITATAVGSAEIVSPSVSREFSLICLYTPTPRILTTDLGTWEDQRYREVQLDSFVPVSSADLRWDVSPKLPAGLTLDPKTGLISGVPDKITETYSMEHEFLLHANGLQAQKRLVVLVYPSLQITTPTQLPDLTVGTEYEVQLEVFGAQGSIPPKWVSVLADMPQGLQLSEDGTLHTVSGVPGPTVGEYTFRIGVTDGFGRGITKIMRLECVPTSHIVSRELAAGVVGAEYRTTIQSSGAGGLVLKSGSLPSGLRLSAPESSTYGTISGVPLYSGTYEFVISLGTDGKHTRSFSIVISEPPMFREEKTLPTAMKDWKYSHRIAASGSPTLEFSDPHHSVPAGLTLDPKTGLISGTPTDPKEYAVDLGVSSVHGHDVASPSMRVRSPIVITTDSLPAAHSGMEYSAQLTAEGLGDGDVWNAAGLPAGLSLNSKTGLISGTPTDSGGDVRDCIVTITIFTPEEALFQKQLILGLNRNPEELPSILPETLPDGYTGEDYEQKFTLKNAPEGSDVFWSRTKAAPLPAGFSLDAWTGVMTGRGGSEESETAFTLMASIVAEGKPPRLYATRDYTLKIVERPPVPTIMPKTLRAARVQEAYAIQLTLENFEEDGPVHWSILEPDQAPSWMKLDMFSGAISGTPDSAGIHNFRVWAYRQNGEKLEAVAYRDYTLECVVAPVILPETLPEGKAGETYAAVPLELSVPKPAGYDWMFFPHAPDWLELNPETGELSGKGAAVYRAEPYTVSVVVATHFGSDVEDIFASKVFSLKISKDAVITTASLPPAVAGERYSGVKLTVDPPNPEYRWALDTEEGVSDWLDVHMETGELHGTPEKADEDSDITFTAQVKTEEEWGKVLAQKRLSLHIKGVGGVPAILPVPAQLEQSRVGIAYSEDFRVENSPVEKPYFTCSAVLDGMHFDGVKGTLSGTPVSDPPGPLDFTITAYEDDSMGKDPIATRAYLLFVRPSPQILGDDTLPQAYTGGTAYTHNFLTKGIDAGATWTVTGLPAGLSFDPAANRITGSIPASYDYAIRHHFVTVHVQNPDKSEAERVFSLYAGPAVRMAIDTLPVADVGIAYPETTLRAFGKDGAVEDGWVFSSVGLPDGLKIENNVLNGRLSAFGSAGPDGVLVNITMTKDSATATQVIPLAFMNTSVMEWGAIATSSLLPPMRLSVARTYAVELTPIPEIQNAEWTVSESVDGVFASEISKKEKRAGPDGSEETVTVYSASIVKTSQFTAALTIHSNDPYSPHGGVSVTVKCTFGRTDKGAETKAAVVTFHAEVVMPSSAPTITTTSLPPAYEGLEYNTELKYDCTDMVTPAEWYVSGETPLPAGLTLNSKTGVLSGWIGREVTGKTYPVIITVRNKTGMDTKQFEIDAGRETEGPLRFREVSLPAPLPGAAYSAFVTLLGHLDPGNVVEWSSSGFPSGLTVQAALDYPRICQISGTATDSSGNTEFPVSIEARTGEPVASYRREYILSWSAAPAFRVQGGGSQIRLKNFVTEPEDVENPENKEVKPPNLEGEKQEPLVGQGESKPVEEPPKTSEAGYDLDDDKDDDDKEEDDKTMGDEHQEEPMVFSAVVESGGPIPSEPLEEPPKIDEGKEQKGPKKRTKN